MAVSFNSHSGSLNVSERNTMSKLFSSFCRQDGDTACGHHLISVIGKNRGSRSKAEKWNEWPH